MVYERFGKIVKHKYYVKNVSQNHFMKKFQGFGISEDVLHELKDLEVNLIVHVYKRVGEGFDFYLTSTRKFLNSSKEYTFVRDGEGDVQKFVSVSDMHKIDNLEFVW